jgi:glycerol-3-phosphate acyltransferase PlsX
MGSSRIALDVMGGDHAPEAFLHGALDACGALADRGVTADRLLLVGDQPRIEALLEEMGADHGFEIEHASQVIEMGESPSRALRAKRDSSISKAILAVREGRAGSVVSMGNTGACVGAATLMLGTLPRVHRPGISITLELTGSPVTLLDMGANVAPKARHLAQYGAMASIYMRDCLGVKTPRVGLLNIGQERGKGTRLLQEAFELLEADDLSFIGNVEGSDIFRNVCDVVVTDGFTGNVILKLLEQFANFLLTKVTSELRSHGTEWGSESLANVQRVIDYSTYGGALLLGVNGVVIIGHGRSDSNAVANAIGLACRALDFHVNEHIEQGLGGSASTPVVAPDSTS